jgi:hypothetical protein
LPPYQYYHASYIIIKILLSIVKTPLYKSVGAKEALNKQKNIAIYAPCICSQAPRTDKNAPDNPFRSLKNYGKCFVS